MARTNGTTKTEKVFRQWFAVKNGGYKFSNNENYTYTVKVADCVKSFNEELGNQGSEYSKLSPAYKRDKIFV